MLRRSVKLLYPCPYTSPPPCQHFTAFAWARVAFAVLLTQLDVVVVVVAFCVNISAPATAAAWALANLFGNQSKICTAALGPPLFILYFISCCPFRWVSLSRSSDSLAREIVSHCNCCAIFKLSFLKGSKGNTPIPLPTSVCLCVCLYVSSLATS